MTSIGFSTRRNVIKAVGALPLMGFRGSDPDLILFNGKLFTVNPDDPEASAVAIRDGRILATCATRRQ